MNSFWQLLYNLLTDITATLILHLKYFNLCIYCLWIKTKQQAQGPYKLDDITFDLHLNCTNGIYIGKVELRSIMSSSNLNGPGIWPRDHKTFDLSFTFQLYILFGNVRESEIKSELIEVLLSQGLVPGAF